MRRSTYDPDFRKSPRIDSPNMFLRFHLCDPVQGELIATTATMDQAREAAIKYHHKQRVRIKFVEIFDEETQEVYHLTHPTRRYKEGVMRGPCAPVLPNTNWRLENATIDKSIDNVPAVSGDASGVR